MPLEPCRVCGNPVDMDADFCPRCGAKKPGQGCKTYLKGCGYLIVFGILLMIVGMFAAVCDQGL